MDSSKRYAFTLVELLVVIVMIAVLVGIIFPALQSAKRTSDRAVATANLRQIAVAIQAYANDNEQSLPGPLDLGQSARYSTALSNTLGFRLWSYLNGQKPISTVQEVRLLDNPAHLRYRGTDTASLAYTSPSYVINQKAPDSLGVERKPWGYNNSPQPDDPPQKTLVVNSWDGVSKLWAIQDVDQLNVKVATGTTPSWNNKLPKTPLHGPVRLVLFFDWHVESVPAKP